MHIPKHILANVFVPQITVGDVIYGNQFSKFLKNTLNEQVLT